MLIKLWLLVVQLPRILSLDCSSNITSIRIVSPIMSQEQNFSTIRLPEGSALSVIYEIHPVCNYTDKLIIEVDRRNAATQRWLPLCSNPVFTSDNHCHCAKRSHTLLCNLSENINVPVKKLYRITVKDKQLTLLYFDVIGIGGESPIPLFTDTKDILQYSDVTTNGSLYLMTSLEFQQQDVKDTAFPPVIWISIAAANLLFLIFLITVICVILKRKGGTVVIVNEVGDHDRQGSSDLATGSKHCKQHEEHTTHCRLYEEIPDCAVHPGIQALRESAAGIDQGTQVLDNSITAANEHKQLKQDLVMPCLRCLPDSVMLDSVDLPSNDCLEILTSTNPKRCTFEIVSDFSHPTLASISSVLPQTTPTTSIAAVQKASPKVFPRVIIVNNPKPASPQHMYTGLRSPAPTDNAENTTDDCQAALILSQLKAAAENLNLSSICQAEKYSKSSSNVLQTKVAANRRSSFNNATSSEETKGYVKSPSQRLIFLHEKHSSDACINNKLYLKPVDPHESGSYLHPTRSPKNN